MADHPAIRECDIRGPCPDSVSAPMFALAGRNFAGRIASEAFAGTGVNTVVVGGDGRTSTADLRNALIDGLVAGGA